MTRWRHCDGFQSSNTDKPTERWRPCELGMTSTRLVSPPVISWNVFSTGKQSQHLTNVTLLRLTVRSITCSYLEVQAEILFHVAFIFQKFLHAPIRSWLKKKKKQHVQKKTISMEKTNLVGGTSFIDNSVWCLSLGPWISSPPTTPSFPTFWPLSATHPLVPFSSKSFWLMHEPCKTKTELFEATHTDQGKYRTENGDGLNCTFFAQALETQTQQIFFGLHWILTNQPCCTLVFCLSKLNIVFFFFFFFLRQSLNTKWILQSHKFSHGTSFVLLKKY